jgi:tetratricopeptide (TPR) repeat protein
MSSTASSRAIPFLEGQRLQSASDLLRQGRHPEAIALLREFLVNAPASAHGYRLYGVALQDTGDIVGAEAAFRAAVALDPTFILAVTDLSELLRGTGRASESVALLSPLVDHLTTNLSLLTYFGLALQSAGRLEDAIAILSRAGQANPKSAVADSNLAGAFVEANRFVEAEAALRGAAAKGLDAPETWLTYARCQLGQYRLDGAEQAYREVLARRHTFVQASAELAELIWMRTGDPHAAIAEFDRAGAPSSIERAHLKARLLEYIGDKRAAHRELADQLERTESVDLRVQAAQLAVYFDPVQAMVHARRAHNLAPDNPSALGAVAQAHLALGEGDQAARVAEIIRTVAPYDQFGIALLATAWRMIGDRRYQDLYNYQSMVASYDLDAPVGWRNLDAYLSDLKTVLEGLHPFRQHPVGQSLRQGSQTRQDLNCSPDPVIRALFTALQEPIRRHLAFLGAGSDPLRQRLGPGFRFSGAWSVKLYPRGYHVSHVHTRGWISSALHIDLPSAIENGREGWLSFGEAGIPTLPLQEAEFDVKPRRGRVVLFPSYMWHGTVPFSGDTPRMTVAFDLLPARPQP